ncbi:unnamed protein product [Thelazia callipaeda]|uniref:C2H2-type domain-containing protein n=1 Tax=Thelazia callipaeda TaxID=103827 RepID=A0A0N5CXV5_THECL|nr:unnamed protein product [Thelazia callipaeda]
MHQTLLQYTAGVTELVDKLRQRLREFDKWLSTSEATRDHAELSIGRRVEEKPTPQEPGFLEEEVTLASLPDDWTSSQEQAVQVEQSTKVSEIPMEVDKGPKEEIRELVLRNRTVHIPARGSRTVRSTAAPRTFRAANVEILPDQTSQDVYKVVTNGEHSYLTCRIWERDFDTLKGWRMHASKMHKKDDFCSRFGHYLALPPTFDASEKEAAVELHIFDWGPSACYE